MAGKSQYKYKKEYCQRLIDYMAKGFTFYSFGGEIEVCRDTLYNWVKRYPEFKRAKSIAFAKSMQWWEFQGMEGMQKGPKDFNAAVWIFNMKNRFHWRDVKEPESDDSTSKKGSDKFIINFSNERPKKKSN